MDKTKALLTIQSVIMDIVNIQMPFENFQVESDFKYRYKEKTRMLAFSDLQGSYELNGTTMTFEMRCRGNDWRLILFPCYDYLDNDDYEFIDPVTTKSTYHNVPGGEEDALDLAGDLSIEYDIDPKTLKATKR